MSYRKSTLKSQVVFCLFYTLHVLQDLEHVFNFVNDQLSLMDCLYPSCIVFSFHFHKVKYGKGIPYSIYYSVGDVPCREALTKPRHDDVEWPVS